MLIENFARRFSEHSDTSINSLSSVKKRGAACGGCFIIWVFPHIRFLSEAFKFLLGEIWRRSQANGMYNSSVKILVLDELQMGIQQRYQNVFNYLI